MILDGDFEIFEFDGDFEEQTILDGDFGEVLNITSVPSYDGPYEAAPSDTEQVFETAGKRMASNFIIGPIPQNYGLISWDGSTLTVS